MCLGSFLILSISTFICIARETFYSSLFVSSRVTKSAAWICFSPDMPQQRQDTLTLSHQYFFHCWQGGQLDTMLVCSFAAHFHMLLCDWLAGRRSRFRWPGLARDELWVTFCQDKWTEQCILPSSPRCMISCQATSSPSKAFKIGAENV